MKAGAFKQYSYSNSKESDPSYLSDPKQNQMGYDLSQIMGIGGDAVFHSVITEDLIYD